MGISGWSIKPSTLRYYSKWGQRYRFQANRPRNAPLVLRNKCYTPNNPYNIDYNI